MSLVRFPATGGKHKSPESEAGSTVNLSGRQYVKIRLYPAFSGVTNMYDLRVN